MGNIVGLLVRHNWHPVYDKYGLLSHYVCRDCFAPSSFRDTFPECPKHFVRVRKRVKLPEEV